ncbi:hypothetical protein [Magnetospirillum moscoviense]|uniref:Uncharacterized protein n=1 Tax=Magnetospirillum moscoviense TaxID=1437059 RepID=A0A178MN46_9PROT|nr:hypothetical protein [Magnetospirillum moscoviense]OAN49518.1 hypothetical protein A6A05_13525 [Magnetospirillum moscoviense]
MMFGFLKAMFEKEAEAAIQRRAAEMAPCAVSQAVQAQRRPQATAQQTRQRLDSSVPEFISPERQALLRQATATVRAKRQILDHLDDESRAKLVAMAITTFLADKKK